MNETLDGLEAYDATYIADDYETTIEDWYGKCPDRTEDMVTGRALEAEIENVTFKYSVDGRRLRINRDGKWIQKRLRPPDDPIALDDMHSRDSANFSSWYPSADGAAVDTQALSSDKIKGSPEEAVIEEATAIGAAPSGSAPGGRIGPAAVTPRGTDARPLGHSAGVAVGSIDLLPNHLDLTPDPTKKNNYWQQVRGGWIYWKRKIKRFARPSI